MYKAFLCGALGSVGALVMSASKGFDFEKKA